MTNAYVLMTALPPTKGHLNLIRFAHELPVESVHVIVTTQPSEPFAKERVTAISRATRNLPKVVVRWHHKQQEQDPSVPGFWEMWDSIMTKNGFKPGDYAVTSELYGATLAERLGGVFMPYDPQRQLYYTKATNIRNKLGDYFHDILPEFQQHLVSRITVFGAESTGKTTLSQELAAVNNGHWIFEYARPYLEAVGKEITVRKMQAIWEGQLAIQNHTRFMYDKPYVVQDTDLFSTVGYWEQPHWADALGPVPEKLISDALATKSDLYLITKSNIPFEPDAIRYGIDKRESPDEFWIGIADKYNLNYKVLDFSDMTNRVSWSSKYMRDELSVKAESIYYDRKGL